MSRRRRQRDSAPAWAWLFVGLGFGLAVAVAVYFAGPRAPELAPAAARASSVPSEASSATTAVGAAAEPAQRERRFDFYEILPEFEVVIPEGQRAPVQNRTAPRTVDEPGRYILQAGSFSSLGDADRLQANLALLGIESRIQRVTIDDDVYHRVRIGPIADVTELNRIRRQLAAANIHEPLVMKAPQ